MDRDGAKAMRSYYTNFAWRLLQDCFGFGFLLVFYYENTTPYSPGSKALMWRLMTSPSLFVSLALSALYSQLFVFSPISLSSSAPIALFGIRIFHVNP